ncbi:MAG: alpha/beta fold hydrolase [Armatimonadota bacterium]
MRHVVTVDGRRLSYLHAGQGRALVLLHTIGGSASEYTRIMTALAAHFAVYALDLPGHGESHPLDEFDPVPDPAEVLRGFLREAGIDRASILGNSMSGTAALELAITYPECVDRVILVSGVGPWGHEPGLPSRGNVPQHSSENKEINWFRAQFHDPATADIPGFFEWWVATRSLADDEMIRAWSRRGRPPYRLADCRVPVLLVIGEHDLLHPTEWARAWTRLLPDGRVATIASVRHFLNLEAPVRLAEEIIRFAGT